MSSPRRTALLGVSSAALALFLALPVLADGVRGGAHKGYARLVVDLDARPNFTARIEGDRLVISLPETFEGNVGAVVRTLDEYLADGRLSDDKRTISYALRKGVKLKSFANAKSAVIDLVDDASVTYSAAAAPSDAKPSAQPVPQPAAAAAQAPVSAPQVTAQNAAAPARPAKLRIGDNSTFTRFVFEFDGETDVNTKAEGGIVQLAFNRAATFDLADIRKRLPKAIPAFDSKAGGGVTNVALSLPPNGNIRTFKLDASRIVVDVTGAPDGPAGTAQVTAAVPGAGPATPTTAATASDPALPRAALPPLPKVAVPVPTTTGTVLVAPAKQEPVAIAVEMSQPQGQRAQIARIAFPAPTAGAVFVRGDKMYMVFDRAATFNLTALQQRTAKGATQVASDHGSVLVVPVQPNALPQTFRDGNDWVINFNNRQNRRPDAPLQIATNAATGGEVVIGAAGASYPVRFKDIDSGDTLIAVPLPQSGRAIDGGRDFAQFALLSTINGIALQAKADSVDVRVTSTQVSVGGSLMLSRLGAAGQRRIYDFGRWNSPDVDFIETRQMLERAAAEAQGENQTAARYLLAQFFLARAHEPDAIAVLDLMMLNPQLAEDPALRALRGAARVMREDGTRALTDLSDAALNGESEALLWRAAASAQIGNWTAADQLFRQAGGIPAVYPAHIRGKLVLLAAESALKSGDLNRARGFIDMMTSNDIPQELRNEGDLIRARAYLEAGDKRSAMPILEAIVNRADRRIKLHTEPVLIDLQLADGSITKKDAIDRLERVRYGWPGGDLEFRALEKLGQLYLDEADPTNALRAWRDATTYFPNKPEAEPLRNKLSDAFASLYDGDLANRVAPLTALALFDDNRDLTPPGPRGDQMIQKLADRLVQVDLLDRAADILEHQMNNRLKGVEKARVGARLAVVRLLDRQPAQAAAALNQSEEPNLPAELLSERRTLRAQAWLDQNDVDRGLSVLEGDTSRRAELMRAQLYGRGQKWSQAAEVLSRLTGEPTDKSMDAGREGVLLNLAIATSLSGDSEKLRQLRDRFGPLMADRPNNEAFQLLTSGNNGATGMDMMGLTLRFAELSEFQQAMGNYREKLRAGQLSQIN
ncbi:hypothetical protein ACFSM5_05635 [Lacibacterium aquatile]|uniref:Tetratricopeptide repeat protein n=1 Tax=Lacibacterium aquatile TaxID=1168082 RepID=A0ABW5DMY6_9PROT